MFIGRYELTYSHIRERRKLLSLALLSPLSVLGCGRSRDDTHVEIGDGTKAEVKARAEVYKERALLKKQQKTPKR